MTDPYPDVRRGVPSDRDARAFASLIEQATHGLFHDMLGSAAPRFLAAVFVEPGHDLSYERVLFIEIDGEIVGMVSTYTTAEHGRDTKRSGSVVVRAAGIRLLRMGFTAWLGRRMFSFMDVHDEGDSYLMAIAVDPRYRGDGIGSQLITAVIERAIAAGSHRLALDVDVTNHGAIALYERKGWDIVATSEPTNRWFGRVAVHRMIKILSN